MSCAFIDFHVCDTLWCGHLKSIMLAMLVCLNLMEYSIYDDVMHTDQRTDLLN